MTDDTEARKHIRALLDASATDRITGRWQELRVSARAFLDTPEPAVLTVDSGGIDEVSQDEAVRLLPCHSPDVHVLVKGMTWNQHGIGCPAIYRPAVAKLLTTLRSQLAKQSEEMAGLAAQNKNLGAMLRRFIWKADRHIGDDSMKVISGQAKDLLSRYDLNGDILRALIDPKTGEG